MKKSIIILTALALVAAGCAKQETLVEEVCTPAVKGTYHAAIAGFQDKVLSKDGKESSGVPTKTYIDGAQNRMYWEKEDCISLFKTTANVPYMNLNATGERYAEFGPDPNETAFFAGNEIPATVAVYPYANDICISDDGSRVSVYFQNVQSYKKGTFASGAAPMVAVTSGPEDTFLNFKNAAGFLVIQAYGSTNVHSVRLEASRPISGWFDVDVAYGKDPVVDIYNTSQSRMGWSTVAQIRCDGVSLSKDKVTEFWFALPPGELEWFNVIFNTDEGEFNFNSYKENRTLRRNVVNRMDPVSVSFDDVPEQYFLDPSTGKPMVFTFNQEWWGETHEGYIKYKEMGNLRYCKTETFPFTDSDGNLMYGFWGTATEPDKAVEWSFVWHTDNNRIELPVQPAGYYYEQYNAEIMVFDLYHYITDLQGNVLDWDSWSRDNPCSYYDGNGGFYLYVCRYYMYDVGGWAVNTWDPVLEAQSFYDRRQFWVDVWSDYQTDAEKVFGFNFGKDVTRIRYQVVEGKISDRTAYELSLKMGEDWDQYMDVSNGYASLSLNLGVTGTYTLVAVTDNGTYTYYTFEYAVPEDMPLNLELKLYAGSDPKTTIGYSLSGSNLKEATVLLVKTAEIPSGNDMLSWARNRGTWINPQQLVSGTYEGEFDSLNSLTSYTVFVWAANSCFMDVVSAEITTEGIPFEFYAKGTYQYDAWWEESEEQELYRNPNVENGYVIQNYGGSENFFFTWNADNTLTVQNMPIGQEYSSYGAVWLMESREYFNGTDGDRCDPSYYQDGVFHFHIALYVSAGYFGDFWETFTITEQ